MRPLLLGLALLIAALAGAVAMLPRLVDPAALRERVIAEVEQATGVALIVQGHADLQLLPRPLLSIGRVRLGDAAVSDSGGLVEADRLDLTLRPLALLGGRPLVAGVRVVRPVLRLPGGADPLARRLGAALTRGAGLEQLLVLDGRLELVHAGEAVERLELELRRSAAGAVEVAAIGRWREQPLSLAARSSGAGPGAAAFDLRLTLGPNDRSGSLSLRGTLRAALPELDAELRIESAEAAVLAEAALALAAAPEPVTHLDLGPLALDGRLRLGAEGWRLELRRLAVAEGTLSGSVSRAGPGAGLDLELAGDRLRVSDDILGLVRRLATRPSLLAALHGTLRLRLAALEIPQAALRDLRLVAALERDGRARVERLSARLPGSSELTLEGTLAGLDGGLAWHGRGALATDDLRELLRWRGLVPAGVAQDRLRRLTLEGDLGWSAGLLTLRDLDLQLDATRAGGSLALAWGARPQLLASLTLDRLGLDGYLPAAEPHGLAARLADLAGWLDLAVDLGADVVTWGAARAERVRLVGDVTDGHLTVEQLSVDDLAEMSASAVGGGDLAAGTVELALEAAIAKPARLLRLLGGEPPLLAGRLGPVRLRGTVRRAERIAVELEAAAAGLGADLALDLPGRLEPAPATLRLAVEAPRLAPLLERLGFGGHGAVDGPAALELAVERRDAARAGLAGELRLGASLAVAELRLDASGARPVVAGSLDVPAVDSALLGLAWEIGEAALGAPPGPPSRWPGDWPKEPLLWDWLAGAEVDLRVGGEAVGGADAAHLGLRDGSLRLELASLPMAGGRLAGSLRLDGGGGMARLDLDGRLAAAEASELLPLVGLRDSLAGRLDLEARLAASGASPAALVASLVGEVLLRLRDGRIAGVRAPWQEAGDGTRRLDLLELAGPLMVERGTVTSGEDGLSLVLADAESRVDLRLDLLAWMLEATIRGRDAGEPGLRLFGPPGRVRVVPPSAGP